MIREVKFSMKRIVSKLMALSIITTTLLGINVFVVDAGYSIKYADEIDYKNPGIFANRKRIKKLSDNHRPIVKSCWEKVNNGNSSIV